MVTKSSLPPFEEYCSEIKDIWDNHWLTNEGVKHREFENQLRQYLGCKYVSLSVNGHLALENVITAMEFEPGSEIITTPYTFASTTHAIVRCGLVPVFCDIRKDDFTIDAEKIEALITDKTAAILPVHVYGNICDTDRIQMIADQYNLKVIFDAAHAFGVECDGVSAANFGDASIFSFHATKVFNTIEGGAVCFKDESLADKLSFLRNFGIAGAESVPFIGGNAKMNEFQAAMGICNLRHIDSEIKKRKVISDYYDERLNGIEGIMIPKSARVIKSNYAYYPIIIDGYKKTRNELDLILKKEGIVPRKYFYPLTNEFECYKDNPIISAHTTPVAKYLSDRVLVLPLYADLSLDSADEICNIIINNS